MNKEQYRVTGITCASCAAIIERTLGKVEGVESIAVNVATEMATLEYDEQVTLEQVNNTLKGHGYEFHSQPNVKDHSTSTLSEHKETTSLHDEREEEAAQLKRIAVPTFIAAVFVFVAMMLEMGLMALGYGHIVPMRAWWITQFAIATPVLFLGGSRFFAGVWRFIRYGRADMNTLVGIGTTVAYIYSTALLLIPELHRNYGLPEAVYFDATIVVIGFVLFGKYLEVRSKLKTGEAIEALVQLQANLAHVEVNGTLVDKPLAEVMPGDVCVVKIGEKVPVDGEVIDGTSHIDESMITGESIPVKRTIGDNVIGATVNTEAVIKVRTTAVGSDTVLSQIIKLVQDAQGSKAPIQRFADTIAAYFVPAVLIITVIAVAIWLTVGANILGFQESLPFAISALVGVLVIACPCALGLATPTAIIVSTGTAARQGILIKNAESLERAHAVDTIIFDKTGTLTEGKPTVTDIVVSDAAIMEDQMLLQNVFALEQMSSHPLGAAIVQYAREQDCTTAEVSDVKEIAGAGIMGSVDGTHWMVGTVSFMDQHSFSIPPTIQENVDRLESEGKTVVFAGREDKFMGIIALSDVVKNISKQTIQELQASGITAVMMTGDNDRTAQAIANQVGIEQVYSQVKPEDKSNKVIELQEQGKVVAMVGDGINDAPALAQADVGMAMSTGTDVAMESADITILHGDIRKVAKALSLSKRTLRVIKQNLFWAFFYNVIGIPLAAGAFYPVFGIMLNPVFAGMAMAFSSVSVLTNSLRLRR